MNLLAIGQRQELDGKSRACGLRWPNVGPSANVFWRVARDPFFDGFAAVGNDHDRGAFHQRNRDLQLLAGSGRVADAQDVSSAAFPRVGHVNPAWSLAP